MNASKAYRMIAVLATLRYRDNFDGQAVRATAENCTLKV
jgi:hypothetical protein